MARTFNRAYDQADRILNGSGLSSIVYRQGAGRIVTDTLKRVPTYAKNYIKGVANKILYETTGKTLSDTTREDMTKAEVAALEDAMAKAVVSGKGEFGTLDTDFEGWVGLGEKGSVKRDAEAVVGGATVSWNPETGQYEFKDPYDFPVMEAPGSFREEVKSINDWLEERGNTRDQIVDPTKGLVGALLGNFFPQNRLFGAGLSLGSKIVGESKNERYFDETERKHKIRHIPYAGAFKTSMGISPQKVQDISEEHDFFGVKDQSLKRTGEGFGGGAEFGLVGGEASGGYSYDPNTDTTFIDEAPIDTTAAFKHGGQTMPGGLSGINKSININGQPHSLAWINPGEASALKAMGGSGRKVEGIPAYDINEEFDWSSLDTTAGVEDYGISSADMAAVYDDIGIDTRATFAAPTYGTGTDHGGTEDQRDTGEVSYFYPSTTQSTDQRGDQDQSGTSTSADTTYDSDVKDDYQSNEEYRRLTKEDFIQGRHSNKLNPYINALYASGMITDQVADYIASLSGNTISSMMDAYDEGYSFGGPMGTLRGLSRDQGTDYTKKLKLKDFAKELKDLKDKNLSQEDLDKQKGELFSKYQDIAKEYGANITENKRFKGMYSGLEEAAKREGFMPKAIGAAAKYGLLPGSFATAGLAGIANLLTELFGVVGEFTTKEGQSYRLMEDGTLVEPDMYTPSQSDNDPMASIQKPRPVRQASVSEEVEKPLTGIAALQQERSEVASIAERLQPQFDNIASIFGREKAAEMLGQPENIFA